MITQSAPGWALDSGAVVVVSWVTALGEPARTLALLRCARCPHSKQAVPGTLPPGAAFCLLVVNCII
jgi:hypothetical protein